MNHFNFSLRFCPHGGVQDHDWESPSGQVYVCVADLLFGELDEAVQLQVTAEEVEISLARQRNAVLSQLWELGNPHTEQGWLAIHRLLNEMEV